MPKIHFIAPRISTGNDGSEARIEYALKQLGIEHTFTDLRVERFYNYWNRIKEPYDLHFGIKCEALTKDMAKSLPSPSVLWFPDNIRVYTSLQNIIWRIGRHFDIVYSFDQGAIDLYYELGCKNVRHLPPATETDRYRKLYIDKKYDVGFVGTLDIERMNIFKAASKVCNVTDFQVHGEESVKVINEIKIMLNCGRGNTDINQRTFETLACGTFLLTNWIPEEYQLFKDGEHLVYWKDYNELCDKITYYLEHEDEREAIAVNGYNEVVSKHLHRHRITKVLEDIEEKASSTKKYE